MVWIALVLAGLAILASLVAIVLSRRRIAALTEEVRRRKQAEQEARAADLAKGHFLAYVSHEMRTPIHGALGLAELVLRGELSPTQREHVELIRTSAESLLALVNDILDLAQIEARRLVLRPKNFGLRDLVNEAVRLLEPQADKGIDFRVRVDAELPDRLYSDAGRLRQVLLNLISNAIRFTRQGSVAVQLEAAGGEDTEPVIRCEVRDTGIGIRPEAQALLFQPYAQTAGSQSRDLGGSGLGLVISKSIVEQMGGRIGFESTRGVGSTFWFEVPLVLAQEAVPPPEPGAPAGREARNHRRILVVDDHPVNRKLIVAQLANLGYAASAVGGGVAALASLAKESYDAVLMDCAMPDLDGYETCRRLREREDGGRRTVVIAITAHAMEGEREHCRACGMDDLLAKPFRGDELAGMLDLWLEGKAAPPEGLEERLAIFDRLGETTGEEVRQQVSEAFLQQGSSDLETMRQALAREDGAAFAAAAHALAGSSGLLGAAELAAGCIELEALARQGKLAACVSRLEAVEQVYRVVSRRLAP